MSKSFYREGSKQGTQAPSPAPRLIPAETEHQLRTNMRFGITNGGTSVPHRDCQISRSERSTRSMTYEHAFFRATQSPHIPN